jgi:hypothetical protein
MQTTDAQRLPNVLGILPFLLKQREYCHCMAVFTCRGFDSLRTFR